MPTMGIKADAALQVPLWNHRVALVSQLPLWIVRVLSEIISWVRLGWEPFLNIIPSL